MINNPRIEQVNSFNYLGYTVTVTNNRGLEKKNIFTPMRSTIIRTLNNKAIKSHRYSFIKLWWYLYLHMYKKFGS
jgi:hypothetical protein